VDDELRRQVNHELARRKITAKNLEEVWYKIDDMPEGNVDRYVEAVRSIETLTSEERENIVMAFLLGLFYYSDLNLLKVGCVEPISGFN
jgi:hypothetical protein